MNAFRDWKLFGFVAVVFIGLLVRFTGVADRPLHHDECLYAQFAYYWFDNPDSGYYKFDPTYHGPFLYLVMRYIYCLFGVGVAQARLVSMIFGVAIVFTPFLFVKQIGAPAARVAVCLLSFSPLFSFFSRFVGHDMPSLFFGIVSVAAWFRYRLAKEAGDHRAALWWSGATGAALGILQAIKLVSYIMLFIFATFGLWHWISRSRRRADPMNRSGIGLSRRSLLTKGDNDSGHTGWCLREQIQSLPAGIGAFVVAYASIQTSMFRNPEAFWDGLTGSVIKHWWSMHSIERISGPVTYHLTGLLLNELPVLVIVCAGAAALLWRRRWDRALLGGLLIAGVLCAVRPWSLDAVAQGVLPKLLTACKVKSSADVFLYLMCFVFGILGTYRCLEQDKPILGFLNYWSFASLAIYSYSAEKVPWLTVHIAYPMALTAGATLSGWIQTVWERRHEMSVGVRRALAVLAVAALLYQGRLTFFVSHISGGMGREILSQVHSTKDCPYVVEWMKRAAYQAGYSPQNYPIALVGAPVWSLMFYVTAEGFQAYTFDPATIDDSRRFVVTGDPEDTELRPKLDKMGFKRVEMNHESWFVPEHHENRSYRDWVVYAVTRQPFGPPGIRPMYVYWKQ